MVLVDTNVLIDVLEDDPQWADWSIAQLRAQAQIQPLAINDIIYSELSLAFETLETLDTTIESLELQVLPMPRSALFLAGKAFLRYRRAGGTKHNVLPDFFIGAHAATQNMPLLTRDTGRYTSYFSGIRLIAPN